MSADWSAASCLTRALTRARSTVTRRGVASLVGETHPSSAEPGHVGHQLGRGDQGLAGHTVGQHGRAAEPVGVDDRDVRRPAGRPPAPPRTRRGRHPTITTRSMATGLVMRRMCRGVARGPSGESQPSPSGRPPAVPMAATRDSAHRCSISATAATVPGSITSLRRRWPPSGVSSSSPALEDVARPPGPDPGPRRAAAGACRRCRPRRGGRGVVDQPDHACLAEPLELGEHLARERRLLEADHEHLNRTGHGCTRAEVVVLLAADHPGLEEVLEGRERRLRVGSGPLAGADERVAVRRRRPGRRRLRGCDAATRLGESRRRVARCRSCRSSAASLGTRNTTASGRG